MHGRCPSHFRGLGGATWTLWRVLVLEVVHQPMIGVLHVVLGQTCLPLGLRSLVSFPCLPARTPPNKQACDSSATSMQGRAALLNIVLPSQIAALPGNPCITKMFPVQTVRPTQASCLCQPRLQQRTVHQHIGASMTCSDAHSRNPYVACARSIHGQHELLCAEAAC